MREKNIHSFFLRSKIKIKIIFKQGRCFHNKDDKYVKKSFKNKQTTHTFH